MNKQEVIKFLNSKIGGLFQYKIKHGSNDAPKNCDILLFLNYEIKKDAIWDGIVRLEFLMIEKNIKYISQIPSNTIELEFDFYFKELTDNNND